MKSYEQISNDLLERRDKYVAEQRRKKRRMRGVISLFVIMLFVSSTVAYAATNGKIIQSISDWFGAVLITPENEELIGKEVIDNIKPEITHGESAGVTPKYENIIQESNVIDSVASDSIVLPLSVSEFEVNNNTIPEIIMTNGSMALFYQNNYEGWNCKAGDILSFSFEKYESEVVSNQAIVVGYIRDGVLYDGVVYDNLEDRFELEISEAGEYNIYVICATSDYLALKQGVIEITSSS